MLERLANISVLNPNFAHAWYWSGWLRLFAGEADLAIRHFETSMHLNPRAQRGFHLSRIGMAHFLACRFDAALAVLRVSLEESPTFMPIYLLRLAIIRRRARNHRGFGLTLGETIERVWLALGDPRLTIIETDLQSSASGSRLVRQSAGPAVDRWTANEGGFDRIPGASTDARFGWKAVVRSPAIDWAGRARLERARRSGRSASTASAAWASPQRKPVLNPPP
jgi:tetratricopeptide (TPR) repeat protein